MRGTRFFASTRRSSMVVMMVMERSSGSYQACNLLEESSAERTFLRPMRPHPSRLWTNRGRPFTMLLLRRGKPSGPDAKPVNGGAKEHQAKDFCSRHWPVCPSGNKMKLLECLLSRL